MKNPQKTLKFSANLIDLILSREKTVTWRLFDDKDLKTGDIVTFIRRPELVPFAKAKLVQVYEKPVGALTEDDCLGHESYSSIDELCASFSDCYDRPVTSETVVKIVKFELI